MTKRRILEKRQRRAKRKAAKAGEYPCRRCRKLGSDGVTVREGHKYRICPACELVIQEEALILDRESANEVLDRHRERIEAWAAVLTEEEKAAIDQDLRSIGEMHALSESLPYKLATIIDGYELCFLGDGFRFSEESPFITDNGEIDFSKTFTVADLIAETHRFDGI